VVGWVEGSDPSVADEYIVVGGHLDHVGQQAGIVFQGANDNASGSVMVMAMAEAMARSAIKPRRSVCFVCFAGEEHFLLGSEYFAAHPPRPLSQAVGMINLDMVGTGPNLSMDGGATTPIFQEFAINADRLYGGFGLEERNATPARAGASDHSAFVNAGVPTVYFHSGGGTSGRAHTAADVPELIDYDTYYRTTRVIYVILFQMADRP
jgi:Zn-dependent M28 family amino/carboxypeptidase